MSKRLVAIIAGLLTAQAATAQVPVGSEFQVNSYTTNEQSFPKVAVARDGGFVVVWESFGSDGGDTFNNSIQGQRYSDDGNALGSQFQINTYTTAVQERSAVAVTPGGFVVLWQSPGSDNGDTSSFSVQGQRFATDGSALGSQFQVNSYTTHNQVLPAVAVDADGDFVVVFRSNGSYRDDTSDASIQGQRYSSDGSALGSQFQVNSYTTDWQSIPEVAVAPDGDFVVVWRSYGGDVDTSQTSIQGQRFGADGSALGSQFLVNSYTPGNQTNLAVAMDSDGDFIVVWDSHSDHGDTSGASIQGQRYSSDGNTLGSQFLVNSYTTQNQKFPAVAVDGDGNFVVVWASPGSYGSDTFLNSIQGQRFAADGSALGSQFQVNTYTTEGQFYPAVAVHPDGDFVVVWQSFGSDHGDTSDFSIQGQRFLGTAEIFSDGFESGDVTAWSP